MLVLAGVCFDLWRYEITFCDVIGAFLTHSNMVVTHSEVVLVMMLIVMIVVAF